MYVMFSTDDDEHGLILMLKERKQKAAITVKLVIGVTLLWYSAFGTLSDPTQHLLQGMLLQHSYLGVFYTKQQMKQRLGMREVSQVANSDILSPVHKGPTSQGKTQIHPKFGENYAGLARYLLVIYSGSKPEGLINKMPDWITLLHQAYV